MTTRDPRSRPPPRPSESQGSQRDPTQSLQIDPEDDDGEPSHPSLALGTAEAAAREERTKIESPNARVRTPAPPRPVTKPPPIPKSNVDDPDNRIGSVMGSYKVLELLGKGGMGYVYRAEHVKLAREVAIKLLRSDYARRRDAVFRFIQEARTVNRIRHRNIVDVPDIVELDDGTTFIVMEFLRGMSLGKWARTGVDLPRALAVLVQICDGLSAAHAVSVVHRDLKPDNIIVVPTDDGAELVKLLDFGVAKLLNRDDEDVGFQTAAGSVIGTPAYMSPEQAGGMVIDHRSDVYSLGAIMYELFCGQPMFRGRSFGEYVRKHLTETPLRPRLTPAGAEIDERLEALIMRCLEKEPSARFGQIAELRDSLLMILGAMETHLPNLSMTASGLRPPPMPTLPSQPIPRMPTPAHHSQPGLAHQSSHPSSGYYVQQGGQYSQVMGLPPPPPAAPTPWWVWMVGGAVAVAIGVGAAVFLTGRTDSQQQPPQPPQPPVAAGSEVPKPPEPKPPEPKPPEPTITQPTVVQPQQIEVRFDSLPSGGVFADGRSAELCKTPCAFNIDLSDGGPADKRKYIVKSDGYTDGVVVVDLTSPNREFSVTLQQRGVAAVVSKPTGKKSGKTTKVNRPVEDKVVDKPAVKPVDVNLLDPDKEDPLAKKPRPKTDDELDPSHTLDPFHRKSK